MKHTKFQYATTLPTVIYEMYQQRVMDFHFSGVGDVMNYLMKSYCRIRSGKNVSKTVKKVLSHQYLDWARLFRYSEKTMFCFETSRELAAQMSSLARADGYATRNQLTNQIIGAFVASAHVTIRHLSEEMNGLSSESEIKGTTISTYVSKYQHVFLIQTAKENKTSIMALLGDATDIFLRMDEPESGYYIPEALRQIAESALGIRGNTTKEFRKGKAVAISVDGNKSERILQFMRSHQINSPREFLRRVILFFLEARYLIFKDEVHCNDEDFSEDADEDYEDFINAQYAKKDFVRSIYI